MNMQLNQIIIVIAVFTLIVTACAPFSANKPIHQQSSINKNIKSESDPRLDEITVTYLDKTTPFPIHTTVSLVNYASPSISYSKKIVVPHHRVAEVKKRLGNHVFQKIENFWQTELRSQDFVDIENICRKINIFTQTNVDFPIDVNPAERCVGVGGAKFYVRAKNGRENTLTVSGNVFCQEKYIPVGIRRLMGKINALVPKYQPFEETVIAILRNEALIT